MQQRVPFSVPSGSGELLPPLQGDDPWLSSFTFKGHTKYPPTIQPAFHQPSAFARDPGSSLREAVGQETGQGHPAVTGFQALGHLSHSRIPG